MKKIILTLLLITAFALGVSASESIKIGTPIVDGFVDVAYLESYKLEMNGLEHTFHTSSGAKPDGSASDSATAYFLYDDSYIYACICVKDDAVYSRGKAWIKKNIAQLSWENDAVELRVYYEELGEAIQLNQYIFQCDAKGIATTNYQGLCEGEHFAASSLGDDGYTVEFAVPLSFGKKAGDTIGLTIEIDDLHEMVAGADSKMGGHNFNAYGSQHPYKNMVALGEERAANRITVFDDTKEHWARNEISYAMQTGMFNGMGMGFEPDTTMTRAMFVTVLGRVYEKKTGVLTKYDSTAKFTDVDYNSWYGKYVDWASGAGVINGKGDGIFAPDLPVTREEMAVMLFRFSKAAHTDETLSFADTDKVSAWAKKAVSYCLGKGYIGGKANNLFAPKDSATRAEVATVIGRYLKAQIASLE